MTNLPNERQSSTERWLTLHLTCEVVPSDEVELAQLEDTLDAIGALLAEDADVGGSETRTRPQPELVVYARTDSEARLLERLQELAAPFLGSLGLQPVLRAEQHEGDDWREVWKQFYHPMRFGADALLVRPSWIPRNVDDPTLEIVLDPGQAFGTGQHETTRLCLEVLTKLAGELAPTRVLDLGTGSGILGLAAARLFPPARVECLDHDPVAVEAAAENIDINGLAERVSVSTDTLDEIEPQSIDLVLANIRPEVLIPIAHELTDRCRPVAAAVLSGILEDEHLRVAEAYVACGWTVVDRPRDGEWRAIVLHRGVST